MTPDAMVRLMTAYIKAAEEGVPIPLSSNILQQWLSCVTEMAAKLESAKTECQSVD